MTFRIFFLLIIALAGARCTTETPAALRGIDGRGMLSSLASSLMSRGFAAAANGGASQVISLNLTNLFVLILLKALIFAAGAIGAETWKGGYGRHNDEESKLLTDQEVLLFLSYLTGPPNGENECMKSIACKDPELAKKYLTASEMLIKISKMMSFQPDENYKNTFESLQEAVNEGLSLGDCSKFQCGNNETNNGV